MAKNLIEQAGFSVVTDELDQDGIKIEYIGLRDGEKLHETMIPREESLNCIDMEDYYIIQPMFSWWNNTEYKKNIQKVGKVVDSSFEYSSDSNKDFLTINAIKNILVQE